MGAQVPLLKSHIILYVRDQEPATEFYSSVLNMQPSLNVPGMTEFTLSESCVLGLMPERGIKTLLGPQLPDPSLASGTPRAELYLKVAHPDAYHRRAVQLGARELSPVLRRDWGDDAGYSLDPDGHVIAFAMSPPARPTLFKLMINSDFLSLTSPKPIRQLTLNTST